jgi:hypothetical protein
MGVFFKEISATPSFPGRTAKSYTQGFSRNRFLGKNQASYHITP